MTRTFKKKEVHAAPLWQERGQTPRGVGGHYCNGFITTALLQRLYCPGASAGTVRGTTHSGSRTGAEGVPPQTTEIKGS